MGKRAVGKVQVCVHLPVAVAQLLRHAAVDARVSLSDYVLARLTARRIGKTIKGDIVPAPTEAQTP